MTANKTKKGAASIYAVVFVTLLLGIISVSFVRLTLREANDATNNELSSSSRDAALAGVEDAKRVIDTNPNYDDSLKCDFVKNALYPGVVDNEVKIREDADNVDGSKTEQAYTCVTIDPYAPDYKSFLDDQNTVRIIPLKYKIDPSASSPTYVTFNWQLDDGNEPEFKNVPRYTRQENQNPSGGDKVVPPVISLQYIQMPKTGTDPIAYYDYKDGDNTRTLFLTPEGGSSQSTLGINAGDGGPLLLDRNITAHDRIKVNCQKGGMNSGYMCSIKIKLPANPNDKDMFLVASLPYMTGATDFSIQMSDSSNETVEFYGVQYVVDSTGRANDLYTRLEVRLDAIDPNFPYPQFALQTASTLEKYFWVTSDNCRVVNNGSVTNCTKKSGSLH